MSAIVWFYVQDDKRLGPVDVDHIVHLVITAALSPGALVWHPGLKEWTEAEKVPEIAARLPPPIPPGKAGRPAAPAPPEPPPLPPRAAEKPPEPRAPSGEAAVAPSAAAPAAASNPKVEELRHKLEKDPNARVFGQLAEELRKAADFAGAIRVCRDGVERWPNYPSLRLTLGRALLESGELPAARAELEAVLQAAPDNILAERFLGECLEAMGDRGAARAQYLKALALAPGDTQLVARLRALHDRGSDAAAGAPALSSPAGPVSADAAPAEVAPAPHADADPLAGVLDEGPSVPAAAGPELAPIPLLPADETFEIERADDHGARSKAEAGAAPSGRKSRLGDAGPQAKATLVGAGSAEEAAVAVAPSAGPPALPKGGGPPPLPTRRAGRNVTVVGSPSASPAPAAAAAPPLVADAPIAWPNGRLVEHEFADLVREVYSRRWTGLLTLNHMGVEKSVRVQEGRLVFAFSSSRDDRLGELLLRRGRITLHQYVEASRAMGKGIRLGTVLVEQGALDARELVKVVMDHTQEIIYSAFQWTEGLYHFTEGAAAVEPITLKLSTPDVILEGIRRIELWSRIERAVGTMETRYLRTRGYEGVLGEMTLSLEKLSILTGLETEQDVGTICASSTLSHFEVCRTLWAFRVIGVVQRVA